MDEKAFTQYLEQNAREVIDLTCELVRFPSINKPPNGFEGECQRFISNWMKGVFSEIDIFTPAEVHGIESHPAYWPGRDFSDRPNVVGILKGKGVGKSLLFNGHIDVVPEEPLPWTYPPFSGKYIGDKIFGRGSLDMKGGLAAALMAVKLVQGAGINLAGDVIVESVVDEEYAGANGTLACVIRGYRANAGISMEPSWMTIGTSTRCGRMYEIIARGNAGLPLAIEKPTNPIYSIARMVLALEAFDNHRNQYSSEEPNIAQVAWTQPASVVKLKAGQVEPGGTIGIPPEAWLHAWIYGMPTVTADELDQEVRGFLNSWIASDTLLSSDPPEINTHTRFLEGSVVNPNHPIVRTLVNATEKVTGTPGIVDDVEVTGDLGILVNWGETPTIVLGPGGGRLHAADEYVLVDDLVSLTKIYAQLILEWCGIA